MDYSKWWIFVLFMEDKKRQKGKGIVLDIARLNGAQ